MSRGLRGACAAICLVATACAPALKEPPPLPDVGTDEHRSSGAEANALFDTREIENVRRAAEIWRGRLASEQARPTAVRGMLRAELWLSSHEQDTDLRRRAATSAVHAAQWCSELEPGSPECDYWLAASLGVQARERRSTALDALPQMIALFESAREAIPEFDHAGPDRALALLYVRAPGFPTGPGDPDFGLEHARSAVARAPDHPPNQLALAEALGAVDQTEASHEAYRRALGLARDGRGGDQPDAEDWIRAAQAGLSGVAN